MQGRSEDLEMGPTLMEGDTWIWTELRGGLLIMESLSEIRQEQPRFV